MVDKQANRGKRVRRTFVFFLLVLLAGLAVLHVFCPLPYVFTVLVYRGPDFTDIHRFESRTIAASGSPSEWDVTIEPQIATIAEAHPDLDDFDVFLDETETSAFLVVHDGRLVEERYLLGHGRESLQNSFSISKSIMSAAVGVAIDRGAFRLDDPITEHLPELGRRDERFSRITVAHLLDMQSGIRYSSEISFPIINCDDPLIYYHPDLESVVLERTEIESAPRIEQASFQVIPFEGSLALVTRPPAKRTSPGSHSSQGATFAASAIRALYAASFTAGARLAVVVLPPDPFAGPNSLRPTRPSRS